MIYLFSVYLAAVILSLFTASWRVAFWAIAIESLTTSVLLYRNEGIESWTARIQLLDFIVIRAAILPVLFVSRLRQLNTKDQFDTVPPNFVIWIFASVLFIVSYWLGERIFPSELLNAFFFGTSISAVLIGIFVLANQSVALGQVIGLLTLESGIALSEVAAHRSEEWAVQLGVSVVFVWTVAMLLRFLRKLSKIEGAEGRELALREEHEVL